MGAIIARGTKVEDKKARPRRLAGIVQTGSK
jgi:hypothetical protein